ncbi:hypothetical protein [Pantoea sp. BAV 3049]|uniref:hypothetical protein n=1 Tax=Pantoea sp. BAV 3049 TaxID=2654188 RepID=UPI00131DD7D2|nr:hypothetical protein [Pantoea sp. BAV 3049]
MSYGVYLTTTDGRPFITPESTPVSLLTKVTASGNGSASTTVSVDTSLVNIPFILSDAPAFVGVGYGANQLTVSAHRMDDSGGAVNLQAYIFSVVPPALPKWGIALWDATGKCILTNETRVLRDVTTIGSKGDDSAGININQSIAGKWAIMPDIAGYLYGVYQQAPIVIVQGFYAQYNGASTQVSSVLASSIPTGTQGSITNSKNSIRAIDASLYD